MLRNATILAHWAYSGLNNVSFTSYPPDNFGIDYKDKIFQPKGFRKLMGNHVCIDPKKDLPIPTMFPSSKYPKSPYFNEKYIGNRTILGFHKGRLLNFMPKYSRGTRQKLAKLCEDGKWWDNHRMYIGEQLPKELEGLSYSEILSTSVFCMVLMGEGFSTRFEDAIVHGCIPVIIMDDVLVSFQTIIDVDAFSFRVPVKDMGNLPEILKSVPQDDIARMQGNLAKIWNRFTYNFRNEYSNLGPNVTDDAFATIMQWLYSRIDA